MGKQNKENTSGKRPAPTPATAQPAENAPATENVHQKFKKARGMSFEGKCGAILKLLRDSNSFWKIPEIEAHGRSVGVVPQSVKDVVMTLVSENKVKNEKVGSLSIFWALASEEKAGLLTSCEKLNGAIEECESSLAQLEAQKEQLASTVPSEELSCQAKQECDKLQAEIATMEKSVILMKENDPVEIRI